MTRQLILRIVLALLIIGNIYGMYNFFAKGGEFLAKNPAINTTVFLWLKWLPLINIIAITGIFLQYKWALVLLALCFAIVVIIDVKYEIWYHLLMILCFSLILFFLIRRDFEKYQ
jgi:Ca2+/Na+ antiporter